MKRLWFFKNKNLFLTLGKGWVFKHKHLGQERAEAHWVKLPLHQVDPQAFNFQYFKCCQLSSLSTQKVRQLVSVLEEKNHMRTPQVEAHFSIPHQLPCSQDLVSFLVYFKTSITSSISQSSIANTISRISSPISRTLVEHPLCPKCEE